MEIVSIFTVTDYKTKEIFKESINGFGQDPTRYLRKKYPKFSKIVLKGFELNGRFKKVRL